MCKTHHYELNMNWLGNTGEGTKDYNSYQRNFRISGKNKSDITGSSDPAFRGDSTKYNPEELLLASLSSCHMLWFLHLCSANQIVVVEYKDTPTGVMQEASDGSGYFSEVVLNPTVTISSNPNDIDINMIHAESHKKCFIANSVNFPVKHNSRTIYLRKETL